MEDKAARFTILIDADRKRAFDELCASQDATVSQVIRQLINDYISEHEPQESTATQRVAKTASK